MGLLKKSMSNNNKSPYITDFVNKYFMLTLCTI